MSSAKQITTRPLSRRTFKDAGPEPTGSRRKVAPRRRPGSCLPLRATPLCANEEIKCSATATDLSFLRHSHFSSVRLRGRYDCRRPRADPRDRRRNQTDRAKTLRRINRCPNFAACDYQRKKTRKFLPVRVYGASRRVFARLQEFCEQPQRRRALVDTSS